ncbi:MAG: diaminopimelate epimerase [Legionella sp.]|nr:diaminopimelate epimerase [Legionella sp.]
MIQFTKMHGLGNDFMVIDGINQCFNLNPEQISALANRHTGVGFDQLLLIEPSTNPAVDFHYRIFNADGSEVGQCGNGARCLAVFARYYGLTTKENISVATKTTQMNLKLLSDEKVCVDMGKPILSPAEIPFLASPASSYPLQLSDGMNLLIHALNVGNPHAVTLCDNVATAPVGTVGREISHHPYFPEGVNAGFMQIMSPHELKLRVYERGCGETLACGSGAVAAAAVGRLFYKMSEEILVHLAGGELIIRWPDLSKSITMTGTATLVFEGVLHPFFLKHI